jgi:hypothetical protein
MLMKNGLGAWCLCILALGMLGAVDLATHDNLMDAVVSREELGMLLLLRSGVGH